MSLTATRNRIFHWGYRHLFKPIVFRMDPEQVHDSLTAFGERLGKAAWTRTLTSACFSYTHPSLEQNILGIHFANPIGLAAGFDKDARLTSILPAVGFGFAEVGSITGKPCTGNPKPRLWRLKKSKSLLVYYGLKNEGAEAIAQRLKQESFTFPVGTSVAKTNCPETVTCEAGVEDYAVTYRALVDIGSYTTINISCPNAFGGEPFTDPERLEKLLTVIDGIPSRKPIFIKLSPDLSFDQVNTLIDVMRRHSVHGIICSNLTKKRENPNIHEPVPVDYGGMSGKVVEPLANKLIEHVYTKTRGQYVIIGCGGVFTAEDAYKKIRLGASLIQMITGMIFEGPQVISEINRGLVELLKRDGYTNISQAVGADALIEKPTAILSEQLPV